MDIRPYHVRHPILKKYIGFYYLLKAYDEKFDSKYFAFPTNNTPLSIHKNARAEIKEYSTSVFAESSAPPALIVQGMRNRPLFVRLTGRIDKVTIIFKPLGINRFIRKSFVDVCPRDSQFFSEWETAPGYRQFINGFYGIADESEKIEALESFLLTVYNPHAQIPVVEKALELLADFDNEKKIAEISETLNLNVRTFNRLFKEHVGISPAGFRKISRFRRSLESHALNKRFERLTALAYENNYYDQAYFNKIYRELTGSNPKSIFKNLEPMPNSSILFKFVK